MKIYICVYILEKWNVCQIEWSKWSDRDDAKDEGGKLSFVEQIKIKYIYVARWVTHVRLWLCNDFCTIPPNTHTLTLIHKPSQINGWQRHKLCSCILNTSLRFRFRLLYRFLYRFQVGAACPDSAMWHLHQLSHNNITHGHTQMCGNGSYIIAGRRIYGIANGRISHACLSRLLWPTRFLYELQNMCICRLHKQTTNWLDR